MDNKRLEKWKLKTKGIFYKITYDEFWFYIDDLMKENKRLTNNWNELEEWLAREYIKTGYEEYYRLALKDLYDKMKEIKERKNENI